MRGKQPGEVLWKENGKCKGTGVGTTLEGQEGGSTAGRQHVTGRGHEG